ncbi:hypothetical protein GIB67_019561 [Kingdonia uniflora]|uniref:CCHC-type domain-containing protein n=1 Tax=Kingdonia uniflora TaxID=39325 RepID=A0A7J7N096_9MAGN|nr:hypothetical protein GIB67_019561 [Kingdonia uniflora]
MDEGTSIGDHLGSLNGIVSELESIGVKVEDEDKALQLIWSIRSTFKHLQPTLMYGKETLSFKEVTSTLLSEERRLKGSESLGENSAMVVSGKRSFNRFRKGTCWSCGQSGHYRSDCKTGKDIGASPARGFESDTNKLATVTSNDDDEALLVVAADGSRHDRGWVFDSGATMHVCAHKAWFGKVGALIASIPQALAASVLCFIWALIVALGLSTLQYTETKSFRNIMIIGVSLFLSLSVPSYFQQYQPVSGFVLPSYFVPYAAASSGPFRTGINELDFAVNGLLSLNMVIAFFIAFILDNTVPGSRQERGVYVWSTSEELSNDPSLLADYSLPRKVAKIFRWAKCVGM